MTSLPPRRSPPSRPESGRSQAGEAWRRAVLLQRLRTPARVRRALAEERSAPELDLDPHPDLDPDLDLHLDLVRGQLSARDLRPWIPWNPVSAPVLLVAGTVPSRPGVGVVGTRASDGYGLACSARVAEDAVALGMPVVSGGAEGCDAAAHTAALRAGGQTVVVLPCGHDRPYPASNARLFAEVVGSGGALVSPWWPDTPPARHRFLARNAVIAGLSAVTVVTRAGRRSGALSTARAAQRLGLPVLAVPGDVGQGLSEGANALLALGAPALTGRADLGRALGLDAAGVWPVRHAGSPAPWAAEDAPLEAASEPTGTMSVLLADLAVAGPSDLLAIVGRTGLAASELAGLLLEAELAGWLERLPSQRYRVSARGRGRGR